MQALRLVNTLDIEHAEWLRMRRLGLTGTDIGAIAGLNKWKSPVAVYLDKVGQGVEIEDNDAMYFGRLFEDVIAKEFARREGKRVERRNAILQHPEHPWALANIDRLIIDKENGNGILECKTASEYLKDEWDGENVPPQYLLQLQWYLFVTGLDYGYFATLLGGNKFIVKKVERDEELIGYAFQIAEDFWFNNVQAENPPAFDGSEASADLLKALYPQSEPDTEIHLPKDAEALVEALDAISEELKETERQKKEYENQLKDMLKDYEKGLIGERTVIWKSYVSNRLDTKRLKAEHPEIYEQYINQTSSRRFSVK